MNIIKNWKDVPAFENEIQESTFWKNHQIEARLMHGSLHKVETKDSVTITLRFDPRMLSRIKRIAKNRFLNYQSMIKQWLSERVESELKNLEK
jgi:predicted DNA binding CopG/RHH family protein